jgi:5-methylcytosine-specific restriction endonuclease McrA
MRTSVIPLEHQRRCAQRYATPQHRRRLYLLQDGRCALCGVSLPSVFDVDHIVPFTQGGPTSLWNLQAVCLACHRAKTPLDGSHT